MFLVELSDAVFTTYDNGHVIRRAQYLSCKEIQRQVRKASSGEIDELYHACLRARLNLTKLDELLKVCLTTKLLELVLAAGVVRLGALCVAN
jgi:hypothetical protein